MLLRLKLDNRILFASIATASLRRRELIVLFLVRNSLPHVMVLECASLAYTRALCGSTYKYNCERFAVRKKIRNCGIRNLHSLCVRTQCACNRAENSEFFSIFRHLPYTYAENKTFQFTGNNVIDNYISKRRKI